jgi:hypothetical protein
MTDDYRAYLNGLDRKQLRTEESNLRSLVSLPVSSEAKAVATAKLKTIQHLNTEER